MIWLIAKRELYDNWQSHKITFAFVLCAILLTVSVWLGLKDYAARVSSYSLTRTGDTLFVEPISTYIFFDKEGRIKPSTSWNINEVIDIIGIYRRPVELSILAKGLEDRMNRPIRLFNIRKFGA